MRSRIRAAYPETVMLFYVDDEKQRAVSDVMEKLSVRVIVPEREKYGCTVGYLAGFAGFSDSRSDENGREGELMIFAGISSKCFPNRRTDSLQLQGICQPLPCRG